MIDLCMGPHIPNTGKIKAMMITKVRLLLQPLKELVLTFHPEEFLLVFPGRPKQ